jgi:hypothetical protein
MNRLVNPMKALRTLRKGPPIFTALLADVSQEQAKALRDGPDGWCILEIMGHMRDVETLFTDRVRTLLERPGEPFEVRSNEEIAGPDGYMGLDLQATLAEFSARRTAFITMLEGLNDEQWLLEGVHPVQGPATLLDVVINTGLHDTDHLEQIVRCKQG